jgi:hypothetical protein
MCGVSLDQPPAVLNDGITEPAMESEPLSYRWARLLLRREGFDVPLSRAAGLMHQPYSAPLLALHDDQPVS